MKAIIGLLIILSACQVITSFEECADAGFPVQESYPRQCDANGQVFTEELPDAPDLRPELNASFQACPENPGELCTLEYDPVCGLIPNEIRCVTTPCASTDAVTFGNACQSCQTSVGYYKSPCENQLFVVCQETFTGFDPVEYAENNGGVCVDICPGNYDAYTTQIGVELCIPHYGVEEIDSWETCDKSSDTCNCVNAYETTAGEEIPESEYRCVPEMYAERLLFRSGQDRLDENGDRSIVIA